MSKMSRLDEEVRTQQRELAEHISAVIMRNPVVVRYGKGLTDIIECALQQDEPGWIYRALIAEGELAPTTPPSPRVSHRTPQEPVGHTPSRDIIDDPTEPMPIVVIDEDCWGDAARLCQSIEHAIDKHPIGSGRCRMYAVGREIHVVKQVSYTYGDVPGVEDE